MIPTRYEYHVDIAFKAEELKPYSATDVNHKFPGEDNLIWCDRCKINHRRGVPWEVEQKRILQKMAQKIADRIDGDMINALT